MLNYDASENILYAYKNKYVEPIPDNCIISPDKVSYDEYFGKQIYEDIKTLFMPTLRKMCGLEEDSAELYIEDIKATPYCDYMGQQSMYYKVKFGSYKSGGTSEYVTVFKAPVMDDFGVLSREGSDYAVIKLLEQDEVISYEPNAKKLKIKFPRGDISIKAGTQEPIINISRFKQTSGQKNFSAINLLFAMCENEGVDSERLYKQFTNNQLSNRFNTVDGSDDRLLDAIEYLGGNVGSINAGDYFEQVIPAIKSEQYDVSDLRGELNKLLSLDRALGKILDEDVPTSAGYTVPAGTVITQSVLNILKSDKVTCIHVKHTPNMLGYFTAEIISIPFIRRGTKIIDIIRRFLPEETGMYVSRDYDLRETPIQIMYGTQVTEGFMELLAYNDFPDVLLVPKVETTRPPLRVNFRYEVMTNNHHYVNGEWVYIDANGVQQPQQQYLTAHDIAALMSVTQLLFMGQDWGTVTNSDIGFRKRIVMPGELFHRAFEMSVKNFYRTMRYKFKEMWNGAHAVNLFIDDAISNQFYPLHAEWWKVLNRDYRVLELLDVDDKTNPVSYMSALTKIVSFVKDKNSISGSMRDISLSQYGKIDPFESPQSRKLGVVNNLATGVVIKGDQLYTKYYRVVHIGNTSYVTNEIVELSSEQEEKYRIADIGSLVVSDDGKILNTNRVLCKVPEQNNISKQTVLYVDVQYIDLVNCTPNQFVSWATSTIPFMNSNDAVRVAFGVAQTKQAKGLVNSEVPCVMTSANKIIPKLNRSYCIFAERDGTVFDVTQEVVAILYDGDSDVTPYYFKSVESALYSCTVRKPTVKVNQRVSKGDVLMTSNFVKDGILSMGVEALVAYIPNGYNYEDGNYISTRLCNKLTSYRVNHGTWDNEVKYSNIKFEDMRKLNWCNPTIPLFKIRGYKGGKDGQAVNVYPEKEKGFLHEVSIEHDKNHFGKNYIKGINYSTVSIDAISTGDKSTNRHGNKGVIVRETVRVLGNNNDASAKKVNNSKMLRLVNGEFLDIVYNPHGVVSRMNVGQIKECNLGLVCHVLGIRILTDPFNSISDYEIELLLNYTYDLANTEGNIEAVFSRYPEIPKSMHDKCKSNIDKIRHWKGVFDQEGNAYLINPKNGMRQTETKAVIGFEHVYKLVQESDKKIHVRGGLVSGEPYLEMTNAPTKSAANNGGQKFGTMEMDALAAYGCSSYMWELFNIRGDNGILRNNWNAELLHKNYGYYIPDNHAYRRSTFKFIATMLALGVNIESDRNEIPGISEEDLQNYYTYTKTALLTAQDTKKSGFKWQKTDSMKNKSKEEDNLNKALEDLRNMFKRDC